MIWRIFWHAGRGTASTAETDNPVQFITDLRRKYGHLDALEVYGCYRSHLTKKETTA